MGDDGLRWADLWHFRGAALQALPICLTYAGRDSPKSAGPCGPVGAGGLEASAAGPPPPTLLPSFLLWSFLASTPSSHHPEPSLASYPDMFFPLRSLHPAKSLVSSHLGLSADALISLPGKSPLPLSLLVSQRG